MKMPAARVSIALMLILWSGSAFAQETVMFGGTFEQRKDLVRSLLRDAVAERNRVLHGTSGAASIDAARKAGVTPAGSPDRTLVDIDREIAKYECQIRASNDRESEACEGATPSTSYASSAPVSVIEFSGPLHLTKAECARVRSFRDNALYRTFDAAVTQVVLSDYTLRDLRATRAKVARAADGEQLDAALGAFAWVNVEAAKNVKGANDVAVSLPRTPSEVARVLIKKASTTSGAAMSDVVDATRAELDETLRSPRATLERALTRYAEMSLALVPTKGLAAVENRQRIADNLRHQVLLPLDRDIARYQRSLTDAARQVRTTNALRQAIDTQLGPACKSNP